MNRCQGITKKGERCRKKAKYDDGKYCHQHREPNIVKIIKQKKKNTKNSKNRKNTKTVKTTKVNIKKTKQKKIKVKVQNNICYENKIDIPERTIECPVCYSEYKESKMFTCTAEIHHICKYCIQHYMNDKLNQHAKIDCFAHNCSCPYSDDTINKIFHKNKHMHDKYIKNKNIHEIKALASILDNYSVCPFCSQWGCIIDNLYDGLHPHNINSVSCRVCNNSWCIFCRCESHGSTTCNRIPNDDDDVVYRMICKVVDEATIHSCPACKTKYHKDEGCNLMECPACHSYSCYLCGVEIIPDERNHKYTHFDNDPCSLYNNRDGVEPGVVHNGNIKYNSDKIKNAIKDLIEANSDRPNIVKKIEQIVKDKKVLD